MKTASFDLKELKNMKTERLLDLWELTTEIQDPYISTVRSWLMDELEGRNPEGFECWLDSSECADDKLRNYIL